MLKIVSTYIFLLLTAMVYGQQGDVNSPFSRFGIGDLTERGGMHLRQMGGLNASFVDQNHLNFENPAALSYLTATAFDVGTELQRSSITEGETNSSIWSGNLSYLSLGFPLRNPLNKANDQIFGQKEIKYNWGMGFNLTPISTISYDISSEDSLPNIGRFNRNFNGTGGFWKATWGSAVNYEGFALGANIGFLFGRNEFTQNIDFVDEITAFDNVFTQDYTARGFYWDAGALYTHYINKDDIEDTSTLTEPKIITIGVTAKSTTGLSIESDVAETNILVPSAFDILIDTVFVANGVQGSGTLPAELGFGATYYYSSKFAVGFDVKRIFWSQYENDAVPEELDNTTRLAVGGYFRPDSRSNDSFFKRVSYRFGAYVQDDPRVLDGQTINNFGLTMGFGLPLSWQRKFSNLNLGFTYGRRSVGDLLSEEFIRLSMGFTFNDKEWFIKRKYN